MKKNETGAFAIETVLVLTFFMLSILAIMFMAVIIKVQASMQYAISQTAKEISGYYYLIDKIGLASVMAGTVPPDVAGYVEDANETIDNFATLMATTADAAGNVSEMESMNDLTAADLAAIGSDVKEIKTLAGDLGDKLIKDIKGGDAKHQVLSVLKLFGKSMLNQSLSVYVAPYVCQALMPKYLTSGDIEDYCEASGLSWNTTDMDFSRSQLLLDGRSIKIDVIYTLNTKALTFGMIDLDMKFHQCASTAAWVKPQGGSIKTLTEASALYDLPTEAPTTAEGEAP